MIDSAEGIDIGKGDIKTGSDGLHFAGAEAKKWADAAAKKILEIEKSKQNSSTSSSHLDNKKIRGVQ